jgi:hypothetical protein
MSSNSGIPNPVTPETVVEQLRALRAQIPDYGQLPVPISRKMSTIAHLDADFVKASINAVGASDSVRGAIGRNDAELRQDADEVVRWSAVEDELRALLKGVSAANLVRRHRLGLTALQAYAISRQLARKPENSDLLPHLHEMKRLNRFGRKSAKAPQAPQPAPQPAPQVPQPVPQQSS